MKHQLVAVSILVLLALATTSVSFAQFQATNPVPPSDTAGGAATLEELFMQLAPKSPQPNSRAVVEIKAPSLNIGSLEIEWLENGKLVDGGIGKTTHSFTSGKAGSVTVFTARVKTVSGNIKEKSITVRPAAVDLVWQTPSTVPPFYKGKALYPLFGRLSVVALPEIFDQDGQRIPDSSLVYTWTKRNEVQGKLSGYGRNVFNLASPELRFPFTVGVAVELADGTAVANETITIDTSEPTVRVYENSPLYGVLFNRELGENASLVGQEAVFDVYPFFFGRSRNKLTYAWYVNGNNSSDFTGPSITLRKTGTETGISRVSVQVSNGELFTENINRFINVAIEN